MNPGQVKKKGDRGGKTLAALDPADKERYRTAGQKDADLITLDCASCHVADAADLKMAANADLSGLPRAALLPAQASGAEMLPISYELQCKACHPLTFDARLPKLVAPHRAQPPEIRKFLVSTYAGIQLAEDPELLKPFSQSKPPIVGRPAPRFEESAKSRIEAAADAAERVLYQGKTTCIECPHHQGGAGRRPPQGDRRPGRADFVVPARPLRPHGPPQHGVRQLPLAG